MRHAAGPERLTKVHVTNADSVRVLPSLIVPAAASAVWPRLADPAASDTVLDFLLREPRPTAGRLADQCASRFNRAARP